MFAARYSPGLLPQKRLTFAVATKSPMATISRALKTPRGQSGPTCHIRYYPGSGPRALLTRILRAIGGKPRRAPNSRNSFTTTGPCGGCVNNLRKQFISLTDFLPGATAINGRFAAPRSNALPMPIIASGGMPLDTPPITWPSIKRLGSM